MTVKTDDLRIDSIKAVATPTVIMEEIPITGAAAENVYESRKAIQNILHGRDKRLLVVAGPCSIHDINAAKEYAARLKTLIEKYRETFEIGSVEVVLDEMPFGDFVELEGDESSIKSISQQLDLDWDRRILTNYLGLFANLKETYHLPFEDLTFENFSTTDYSAADILDSLPS